MVCYNPYTTIINVIITVYSIFEAFGRFFRRKSPFIGRPPTEPRAVARRCHTINVSTTRWHQKHGHSSGLSRRPLGPLGAPWGNVKRLLVGPPIVAIVRSCYISYIYPLNYYPQTLGKFIVDPGSRV